MRELERPAGNAPICAPPARRRRSPPGAAAAGLRAAPAGAGLAGSGRLGLRGAAIAALLLALSPALHGCASPGAAQAAGAAQAPGARGFAAARPRSAARDELTVVFSRAPVELDFRMSIMASEAQLFTAIYEGLFSYHPITMAPIPALAESWDLSQDGRQWTFTIRQNARFSNGDPITAEDFRRSWLSLISPGREAPYSSMFDLIEGARDYRTGAAGPGGVGVIARGPRTLVVRLNSPASFFPSMLCHHSFSPIHESMVGVEDWSLAPPISNGAFRISEMDADRIVLVRSEYYWDAASVALSRITVRFAGDDEASALWNSGEALWIYGNANLDALTDRSGISVHPLFGTHFYFIRSEEPLDDYRVRRALVLALPWEEMRSRHFLPARTLVNPLPGYPRIAGIGETDPARAARLLEQAGFPGGEGMPELVFRITPSMEAARISGLMAGAWEEHLGVSSRMEVVPFDEYFASLRLGGYHVGSSSWIGDFPDPYSFLKKWRRGSNLNSALHSDDDFERLMDRSMLEAGAARWATLAEAEQLLLDRGSVIPISFLPAVNVIDTHELEGWFPNPLGIHPFRHLSFREFAPLPGVALRGEPGIEAAAASQNLARR